jgi:hypothetical protein
MASKLEPGTMSRSYMKSWMQLKTRKLPENQSIHTMNSKDNETVTRSGHLKAVRLLGRCAQRETGIQRF